MERKGTTKQAGQANTSKRSSLPLSLFQGRYLSNAHSIGALFANVAIGTTSDIYEESQKRLAYAARSEFINKDKEGLQSASDNSERSSPSSVISLTQ